MSPLNVFFVAAPEDAQEVLRDSNLLDDHPRFDLAGLSQTDLDLLIDALDACGIVGASLFTHELIDQADPSIQVLSEDFLRALAGLKGSLLRRVAGAWHQRWRAQQGDAEQDRKWAETVIREKAEASGEDPEMPESFSPAQLQAGRKRAAREWSDRMKSLAALAKEAIQRKQDLFFLVD
jgi:hypothetical protein